jgi:hypothetical protein
MPVADPPAEIEHARRQIVDVDLEPQTGRAVAVDRDRHPRAAALALVHQTALPDETGLGQYRDECGDGGLGEAGDLGQPGPGDRLMPGDLAQQNREVALAHGAVTDRATTST